MKFWKDSAIKTATAQKEVEEASVILKSQPSTDMLQGKSSHNNNNNNNDQSKPHNTRKLENKDSGFISAPNSPNLSSKSPNMTEQPPNNKKPLKWYHRLIRKRQHKRDDDSQEQQETLQPIPSDIHVEAKPAPNVYDKYPSAAVHGNTLKSAVDAIAKSQELGAIAESEEEEEEEVQTGSKSPSDRSSKTSPTTPKKWFGFNMGHKKLPATDSASSLSDEFKSISIYDVPEDRKILQPGHNPELAGKKKQKTDLSEDEEKEIKRREIIGVLSGRTPLVPEFSQKYQLLEVLGDGAFGFVIAAEVTSGKHKGKEAAVKFILKSKISSHGWVNDVSHGWIPFEAHFLKQVSHPNVIEFYDLYKDSKYFYLVTELHGCEWYPGNPKLNSKANPGIREMPANYQRPMSPKKPLSEMTPDELLKKKRTACDLFECIDAHKYIPENTAKTIFSGIVKAVDYLNSIGFVHRDLKDENVVIDEKYEVKLIDFGSASRIPDLGDTGAYFDRFNGTLHFASPEILTGNNYRGPEAEVWALGVLLYTMMFGENPFQEPSQIISGRVNFHGKESTLYVHLIKEMFKAEPTERITLEDIRRHPWLDGYF